MMRAFAGLAGLALIASPASRVVAREVPSPPVPAQADTKRVAIPNGPKAGPVFMTGRLVDSGGKAISGTLNVFEWPTEKVRDALKPGDAVPIQPFGSTATDSDGRFALFASPTEVGKRHNNGTEHVELEFLVLSDKGKLYRFFVERFPGHDGSYWRPGMASENDIALVANGVGIMRSADEANAAGTENQRAVAEQLGLLGDGLLTAGDLTPEQQRTLANAGADAAYSARQVRLNPEELTVYRAELNHEVVVLDDASGFGLVEFSHDAGDAVAPRDHDYWIFDSIFGWYNTCSGWTAKPDSAPLATMTAETQNGGNTGPVTATVVYNSSASSTISTGSGYKQMWLAANATLTVSGSQTKGSGFTGAFSPQTGIHHKDYRVNWVHRQYELHCDVGTSPYDSKRFYQYISEPKVVTGGGSIRNPSAYGDIGTANCEYWPGGNVSTDTASAASYLSAFSLGWLGGSFSGSSQQGYSTNVKIAYAFGNGTGWWCGSNTYPATAQRVRAK